MGVLATIFGMAFVVGLSGAVMPGPVLAVTIKGVAKRGFWFGPFLILGHALLELPVVLGLGLGVGEFLANRSVLGTISIVGGLVLGVMSAGMLKEARTAILPSANTEGRTPPARSVGAVWIGVVTSLSNPYWPLWWATAGLALIAKSNKLAAGEGFGPGLGLSTFYVGHIFSDILWYTFIAVMIATGRKLFTNVTYRILIAVCGLALLVLSGYFLYSGVASFFHQGPLAHP